VRLHSYRQQSMQKLEVNYFNTKVIVQNFLSIQETHMKAIILDNIVFKPNLTYLHKHLHVASRPAERSKRKVSLYGIFRDDAAYISTQDW
jgi:hypothetical protein